MYNGVLYSKISFIHSFKLILIHICFDLYIDTSVANSHRQKC